VARAPAPPDWKLPKVNSRCERAAVGQSALGDVEAEVARNQRLGQFELDVVQLEARLLTNLEGVAEARRGHEGAARRPCAR
jgi:hypothetical protein